MSETDWQHNFYDFQYRLGAYSGTPGEYELARLDLVQAWAPGAKQLLEIGCGAGQTAVTLADAGFEVTAVDLVPALAASAAALVKAREPGAEGSLSVIEGDIYEQVFETPFDAVVYFDGFGVGEDRAQHELLRLIGSWLRPGGIAIIEMYTPWYWAAAAGRRASVGNDYSHSYEFDADGSRMVSTCWRTGEDHDARSQTLRCYGPADLRLLLPGTGLVLEGIKPLGAWYPEEMRWDADAPLGQAQSWYAKLVASA